MITVNLQSKNLRKRLNDHLNILNNFLKYIEGCN